MSLKLLLLLLVVLHPLHLVAQECGSGSYNAEATLQNGTWTVTNGGRTVYTGAGRRQYARQPVS